MSVVLPAMNINGKDSRSGRDSDAAVATHNLTDQRETRDTALEKN